MTTKQLILTGFVCMGGIVFVRDPQIRTWILALMFVSAFALLNRILSL